MELRLTLSLKLYRLTYLHFRRQPQALKVLRTSEFVPYVVFIVAPELETLRATHRAVVDAGITTKLLTDSDLKKTVDESTRIQEHSATALM